MVTDFSSPTHEASRALRNVQRAFAPPEIKGRTMGTNRNHRSASWSVGLFAVACVIVALTGCAKGRNNSHTTAHTAANGIPVYSVSVSKFTYSGMPDSVPADKPFTIVFSNNESFDITHEMVVVAIPDGKTVD